MKIIFIIGFTLALVGCQSMKEIQQAMRADAIKFKQKETAGAVNGKNLYQLGKVSSGDVNIKSDSWEKNVNKWTAEIPSLVGPTLWECSSMYDPKTGALIEAVSCYLSKCYPNCN